MTSSFLQTELSNLITDSKRKNNEVRTAAEKSLADIKAISVTSESQLAGDLSRRPLFVNPFTLACHSKNAKLINTAVACLQRLVASRAVPRAKLEDVLAAFNEVSGTTYDVQLKILQTLPALLQLYANDLHGDLLAAILEVCATLQSSKTNLVNKSASATFQQLISTVFDNANKNISRQRRKSDSPKKEANDDDDTRFDASEEDARKIFDDFCALTNRTSPIFLHTDAIPTLAVLQTLESVIDSYEAQIRGHAARLNICRSQLVPGLLRTLTSKDDFILVAHALRIIFQLLRLFPRELQTELQQVLSYLISAMDKDASPLWKRALCLEFFRNACSDFRLLRQTFVLFDQDVDSAKIISNLMASLVRLAAEDPVLIGLGRQSTIPTRRGVNNESGEIATLEGQGVDIALASVESADSKTLGISIDWSILSVPLIDQAEIMTIPTIPNTYLYTLILGCVSSFSDGLSKFIMPFSVLSRRETTDSSILKEEDIDNGSQDEDTTSKPRRSNIPAHKYQRLVNPLTTSNPQQLSQVQICAKVIESCWPPVLATCSTFLNATLDSHYYHQLIRSIQKIAQVSGILELATPRDAFLTSLAKASVPAHTVTTTTSHGQTPPNISNDSEGHPETLKLPKIETTQSLVGLKPSLNIRHLLCLRALLNLGIALGPTLEQEPWFIIIEAMYQVESITSTSTLNRPGSSGVTPNVDKSMQDGQTSLSTEMTAVNTATRKMLESTRPYSNASFTSIVSAFFQLMAEPQSRRNGSVAFNNTSVTTATQSTTNRSSHQPTRSISGHWNKSRISDAVVGFVLSKINDLARFNIQRFARIDSQQCSWDLIVKKLVSIAVDDDMNESLRLRSASLGYLITVETIKQLGLENQTADDIDVLQCVCLIILFEQITFGTKTIFVKSKHSEVELEMNKRALESLEEILSQSGESLQTGWRIVFDILNIHFREGYVQKEAGNQLTVDNDYFTYVLTTILPVSFRCAQLIAGDFVTILDQASLYKLTSLMLHFGTKPADVNMALTTINFLRGITLLILERTDTINLTNIDLTIQENPTVEQCTPVSIWATALKVLTQICQDDRRDVRDATLRIVMQVLEAASERLSPSSWRIVLDLVFFSTLQKYQEEISQEDTDKAAFSVSSAHLTLGMTTLIDVNLEGIAQDPEFQKTWSTYVHVLRDMLNGRSLSSFELVFSSLSKLLKALSRIGRNGKELISPVLQTWAEQVQFQPSERFFQEQLYLNSSQAALQARAQMLVEAYTASAETFDNFSYHDISIRDSITAFVRECLTTATHPAYSNDVKKLAPEQEQLVKTLSILRTIMNEDCANYAAFLLEIINTTIIEKDLSRQLPTTAASAKSTQQPTFIAFASACVDVLRHFIRERANDPDLLQSCQFSHSLKTLSAIINTKYTNLPLNSEAPLWRNATLTAVVLLETASSKQDLFENKHIDKKEVVDFSEHIVLAITNILGNGGLESKIPSPADDLVLSDEEFDIAQFRKFHLAAVPLISHGQVSEDVRKKYIISVFYASLIAKPWYFDFPDPDDLLDKPLINFNEVRPGSVHRPVFPRRLKLPYAALNTLFDLLHSKQPSSTEGESNNHHIVACTAAPYLLLRIAHPLKTFLTDQRLRSLTPQPMLQQKEIHFTLDRCLNLHCDNAAISGALYNSQNLNDEKVEANNSLPRENDGKAHLRALYPLILRMQRYWNTMPRLKGRLAWQADFPGREIEKSLNRWIEVVGEGSGWGVDA